MEILQNIIDGTGKTVSTIVDGLTEFLRAGYDLDLFYTAVARWVFIFLAAFILLRAIFSLLTGMSPAEVWAYLHIEGARRQNIPITHWENAVGRAGSCDIQIDNMSVSRNHGTLNRNDRGEWAYMDLGSKNGAEINGVKAEPYEPVPVKAGDELLLGGVKCMLWISLRMVSIRSLIRPSARPS